MRAVRLTFALLVLATIFLLAAGGLAPRLYAQAITAPTPVTMTLPAAPGQPQPFATIGALPALAAAPGLPAVASPAATPTPRVFTCSCCGPGYPTAWVGTVAASSYLRAEQAATGQCVTSNTNANALSPYMKPGVRNDFARGVTTAKGASSINNTAFTSSGQAASSAIGIAPIQAGQAAVAAQCSQCACN